VVVSEDGVVEGGGIAGALGGVGGVVEGAFAGGGVELVRYGMVGIGVLGARGRTQRLPFWGAAAVVRVLCVEAFEGSRIQCRIGAVCECEHVVAKDLLRDIEGTVGVHLHPSGSHMQMPISAASRTLPSRTGELPLKTLRDVKQHTQHSR